MNLTFLGSGNIASAIIGGLLSDGTEPSTITAADPFEAALTQLSQQGINTTTDNLSAVDDADVVLISVKPGVVAAVAQEIAPAIGSRLVISVAAGITTTSLGNWLGDKASVIRCMPNTPALVRSGITGLFATPQVTAQQRSAAETILSAVGSFIWVDAESELDAVTAVSGSGPAYFFYVMEVMEQAAESLGLSTEVARKLVIETAVGAARMTAGSDETPEQLRRRVISPGGTTEAALNSLMSNNLSGAFAEAIALANQRSIELAAAADSS